MKKIENYIKICRQRGFEDSAIKSYLLSYNVPLNLVDESFKRLELKKNIKIGAFFSIFVLMIGVLAFNPQFLGFVTQQKTESYNQSVNIDLASSSEYSWTPDNSGELMSLLASGKVIGNGSVKAYLKAGDTRYLIFDSNLFGNTRHQHLTGMFIDNSTEDIGKSEIVSDATTQDSPQENPPVGEETVPEEPLTITEPANETFGDEVPAETVGDEPNATVETPIENTTIPENVTVVPETNETQADETIPEEQVNETIPEITPQENETIVEEVNETLPEIQEFSFNETCQETCILPGLQADYYTLEFEVDGNARIIINNLEYSTKKIILEVLENITTNITINETLENFTINETLANVTINETLENFTINDSLSNLTVLNATINSTIEIGEPVKWIMRIDTSVKSEVNLPKEAYNITLDSGIVIVNGENYTVNQYNLEKENEILKKELSKLEARQEMLDLRNPGLRQVGRSVAQVEASNEISDIQARVDELDLVTEDLVIDSNITLVLDNVANESNESNVVVLNYLTEGPSVDEEELSDYSKLVTVSSDLHYENIKAYTDIVETQKELVNLYWLTPDGKTRVTDIVYNDTNGNGLVDRIEWVVPHLSNETYEVNISVLNLQSYPMVGGNWVVQFQTTGKADLIITTDDGTQFGKDLEPVSLMCGNDTLTPTYNGTSVFYPDYECNYTGYHTVHVLTQGKHTQKFTFGNVTAYAHNFAGNLPKTINLQGKLTNSTGANVNTTVNFTFSIYATASGGTANWTENQTVSVIEGIYSVILGSINPITVNFSQPYYLGISINSDAEMDPRINLTNQPYAYNTFYAQEALTLTCVDCIGATQLNTTGTFTVDGSINISMTSSNPYLYFGKGGYMYDNGTAIVIGHS